MNVNLGNYLESMVRQKVADGRYTNASEVVREALRRMEDHDVKLQKLRALVTEGEADVRAGRLYDWTPELMDQIAAEADEEDRLGLPIPDHVLP
jgi:antitoxin ParD1/3/4